MLQVSPGGSSPRPSHHCHYVISTPAHVASNFEGLVHRLDGTLWKLVRVFDDAATWTEPGVRHLAASGRAWP